MVLDSAAALAMSPVLGSLSRFVMGLSAQLVPQGSAYLANVGYEFDGDTMQGWRR